MCNIARLDAFADLWPGSSCGPAHCVIEDANIGDEHIDRTIEDIDLLLGPREAVPADKAEHFATCNWYEPMHSREELEATRAFLVAFRAIPEDERMEPGDSRCYEETDEGIVAKR